MGPVLVDIVPREVANQQLRRNEEGDCCEAPVHGQPSLDAVNSSEFESSASSQLKISDNNEFEIWTDKALAHGFGQPRDSGQIARYLVRLIDGEIVVQRPLGSRTPVAYSLENWLRRQARAEIENQLETVTTRLRQRPRSGYVMGQRTKWGNCSASRNLSFNWRLILAPDFVLRYLVTHEAVHLAVPDHSAKFWLTVQSLCPETERAKQWLSANGLRLAVKLDSIYEETCL